MEEREIIRGETGISITGVIECIIGVVNLIVGFAIWPFLIFAAFWILFGILEIYYIKTCNFIVYETRISGQHKSSGLPARKTVDLPLNMISSIEVGRTNLVEKTLGVSTASGTIKFRCINNAEEIADTLNRLLSKRQSNAAYQPGPVMNASDNTETIRNLKKLLDDGIITEEEFKTKKKDLLGL